MFYSITRVSLFFCVLYFSNLFLKIKRAVDIIRHEKNRAGYGIKRIDGPKILIIGDSVMVGVGARPEMSIAGMIAQDFTNLSVYNLSRVGYTFTDVRDVLRKQLDSDTLYDIIIIECGPNDIVRRRDLALMRDEFSDILDISKKISSKVIYLGGNVGAVPIFPWIIKLFLQKRTRKFLDMIIPIMVSKDVFFADVYYSLSRDPLLKKPRKYFSVDKFHPTSEGYRVWYEAIKKYL